MNGISAVENAKGGPAKRRWIAAWLMAPFAILSKLPFLAPLRSMVGEFIGSLMLAVFPLPLGIARRKLVGRCEEGGALIFYSHPRFVVCMHLIWVGWLVAALTGINALLGRLDMQWQLPLSWATWLWLIVLFVTIVALGLDLDRVPSGFVLVGMGFLGMFLLVLVLLHFPVISLVTLLTRVPMNIDWGVPAMTSLLLGVLFVLVAAWQRINDVWIVRWKSNYLEHITFESQDDSIPPAAKQFRAKWPCLLKKYLFFGWGDIVVLDFRGSQEIRRINGVLFAQWHAREMMRRLAEIKVDPIEDPSHACTEDAVADELDIVAP